MIKKLEDSTIYRMLINRKSYKDKGEYYTYRAFWGGVGAATSFAIVASALSFGATNVIASGIGIASQSVLLPLSQLIAIRTWRKSNALTTSEVEFEKIKRLYLSDYEDQLNRIESLKVDEKIKSELRITAYKKLEKDLEDLKNNKHSIIIGGQGIKNGKEVSTNILTEVDTLKEIEDLENKSIKSIRTTAVDDSTKMSSDYKEEEIRRVLGS